MSMRLLGRALAGLWSLLKSSSLSCLILCFLTDWGSFGGFGNQKNIDFHWGVGVASVLGSSCGLLWEFLVGSWTIKRPRCVQDGPKSPHKASKGSPKAFEERVQRTIENVKENSIGAN